MEELAVVVLWVLAFAVGGPLIVFAVMGPPMAVSYGLVWLGTRAPGGLGRLGFTQGRSITRFDYTRI